MLLTTAANENRVKTSNSKVINTERQDVDPFDRTIQDVYGIPQLFPSGKNDRHLNDIVVKGVGNIIRHPFTSRRSLKPRFFLL